MQLVRSQYVVSVYPNSESCRDYARYQPFPLGSNAGSDCVFQKSTCSEEGNILFHHGSPKKDLSCRCNFQLGYGFVNEIQNKWNCVPSQDDCSCYLKHCLAGHRFISGSKTTQYKRYGPREPTLPSSTTTTPTVITTPPGGRDVRLPLNLYPVLYELELQPFIYETNPADFYFSGTVKIEMECRQSTNEIVLHSNQLNITTSSVRIEPMAPGKNPIIPTIEFDTVNHFLVLKTNTQLVGGSNYSVYIEFRGPLLPRPPGFYQSSYQHRNDTM
ncbi:Hypothetical predicted protein [Mytilus galloprovincialis]|uniref:Aminopeptidase N-like N-terminal domain-containing protein n=1 Tax=Mytilus galloprovincialis TaxID=29158 RepID=A0A8B6F7B7_MYTGA|nr:Hypothetical predicted protein [Mytilus galloprovincialis]